ncbi:MAG: tRNA (adenosine(37)-N6)-dimethylallyltransferase MiaA, partial [Planctomycetota bacterium]
PQVRGRLRAEAESKGPEVLHRRLSRLDPEAAEKIHPNDVQRLVRALEVWELTGSPISEGQTQFTGDPCRQHVMVGLRCPREELYARIEHRVDRMMEEGLLAEVESLRDRLGPQARQALGYKELMRYVEGEITVQEAVALIKRNTRRFAKHQLTWFRHFPQAAWVDASRCGDVKELTARCEALLGRSA